jgi:hypothetical protein
MLPRNGCRYNDKLTTRGVFNVAVHMFEKYPCGQGLYLRDGDQFYCSHNLSLSCGYIDVSIIRTC